MREIFTRPLAQADLEGIWLYTYDQWGEGQATRYLRLLDEQIQKLATDPQRGKSKEEIRAGYHSIRVGRHVVFYTFTDNMVGIQRVLHGQMDVGRHL